MYMLQKYVGKIELGEIALVLTEIVWGCQLFVTEDFAYGSFR
jgi:hypothetical protein